MTEFEMEGGKEPLGSGKETSQPLKLKSLNEEEQGMVSLLTKIIVKAIENETQSEKPKESC